MSECCVENCTKPVKIKARGLCGMHAMRLHRHGHLEATRISGGVEDFYTPGDPGECWPWRGAVSSYGYGRWGNPPRMAHRLVYAARVGPIPDGLVIDHLCRNTICVNPSHLEPVPQGLNIERGLLGYPMRRLCRNGLHDVTDPASWYINTYGRRTCLDCKRATDRRAEAKRGARTRR